MEDTDKLLCITDLAYGGDGVGHVDGKVVFVPKVIPGEEVHIAITENKKRFARGKLISLSTPSEHRCEPSCPIAEECPGCMYQHLQYNEELKWKHKQLSDLLLRIGGLSTVPEITTIASPRTLSYRNKIVLHADGCGNMGYLAHDNKTVLPIQDCPLAVEPIRAAIREFHSLDRRSLKKGDHVTFRWTELDGVQSWVNHDVPRQILTETVNETRLRVPISGFWQVNPFAAPLLLETAMEMTSQCSDICYVIDLYCGAGFFTLSMANRFDHVLGIELDQESVRASETNAQQHVSKEVVFMQGDAGKVYPQAQSKVDEKKTLVVVDPPRRGLDPRVLSHLAGNAGPQCLLYVSCAADTLARDSKVLRAKYDIHDIQLVDMFPRTAHFETVVLFRKKS